MVRRGSIASAVVWMSILSLLLFWLPVLGPLIAGFVGGRKAGTVGNAIIAVFIPAVIAAVLLFFGATMLTGVPFFGALIGMGAFAVACIHVGPLLLGAIVGGAVGP
jgi:hypothetical protein